MKIDYLISCADDALAALDSGYQNVVRERLESILLHLVDEYGVAYTPKYPQSDFLIRRVR